MKAPALGLVLIGLSAILVTAAVLPFVLTIGRNIGLGGAMLAIQAIIFLIPGFLFFISGWSLRSYTKRGWYTALVTTAVGILTHIPLYFLLFLFSPVLPLVLLLVDISSLYILFSKKNIFFEEGGHSANSIRDQF